MLNRRVPIAAQSFFRGAVRVGHCTFSPDWIVEEWTSRPCLAEIKRRRVVGAPLRSRAGRKCALLCNLIVHKGLQCQCKRTLTTAKFCRVSTKNAYRGLDGLGLCDLGDSFP